MARYQVDDERYFIETQKAANYVVMRVPVFVVVSMLAAIGAIAIVLVMIV